MHGYDLATSIDATTWASLQNCINESRQIVDPVAFHDRTGFSRSMTMDLWRHLDEGHDAHPLLSPEELLLAAACADLACDLVDDWEFATRVGFEKVDAARLAVTLGEAART